jgi:hypothetical protein
VELGPVVLLQKLECQVELVKQRQTLDRMRNFWLGRDHILHVPQAGPSDGRTDEHIPVSLSSVAQPAYFAQCDTQAGP